MPGQSFLRPTLVRDMDRSSPLRGVAWGCQVFSWKQGMSAGQMSLRTGCKGSLCHCIFHILQPYCLPSSNGASEAISGAYPSVSMVTQRVSLTGCKMSLILPGYQGASWFWQKI